MQASAAHDCFLQKAKSALQSASDRGHRIVFIAVDGEHAADLQGLLPVKGACWRAKIDKSKPLPLCLQNRSATNSHQYMRAALLDQTACPVLTSGSVITLREHAAIH